MAPEPVVASVWLEQQLQRALERIEALTHDMDQLREVLRAEQAESSRLHDQLALLDGRTGRHEAVLDQVRALQQQAALLEERIEAEAALRRDRAGSLDRGQQRGVDAQQAVEYSVSRVESELREALQRLTAVEERLRHTVDDVAASTRDESSLETRLEALDRRIEALASGARRDGDERSDAAAAIPELRLALAALEARTRAIQQDQQRFEDDVARLVPAVDVQTVVDDAVDQVRSLRERVEARLRAIEEQTAELSHRQQLTGEERALSHRELVAHEAQLRALASAIESQRETLVEHVRRTTAAAEDAGRRQMQEIDRQARAGRELLTRLTEQSDEGTQEQPL